MFIFREVKRLVMLKSRTAKLDHFYSLCESKSSVLDVGVSNNEHNKSVNLFLNNFRLADDDQYTGLALQPMTQIRKKHPKKKFVEYPGGVFPFADNEFDWVFSNAVIEHVGDKKDQVMFINEMLRVGKKVFFTTPNKWFPVESHTNVVFRHWFDGHFYEWCKQNHPFWSINNLLLLGKTDLKTLLKQSGAKYHKITSNKVFGWSMTFTVVCSE